MIILIDNGHGKETMGKRSPDGKLMEWAYAREIARRIVCKLKNEYNLDARLLTPEDADISLQERVKRANELYNRDKNTIVVSVHCNAAGDGSKWMTGTGWEVWTSPGKTRSDDLATELYEAAKKELVDIKMRSDYSDNDPDKEAKFYILTKTKGIAVLTENMFQDNKNDVEFLLSEEGKEKITQLHINGIINYINKFIK